MKISIITPNFNGAAHLQACLDSVAAQRQGGIEIEHIVIDGGSRDGSIELLERNRHRLDALIIEPDRGPADAINKGFRRATGDWVAWINADDFYYPDAVARAMAVAATRSEAPFLFGRCRIVDTHGREIRSAITRFKEAFYPISSRFTFQCINYLSQPAMFFRRSAVERAGLLRVELKAAFDYEFFLRLWRQGPALPIGGEPIAAFRWHEGSISGQHFARQFKEEYDAARADAGALSLQALLHLGVRFGIVGSYRLMAWQRSRRTI